MASYIGAGDGNFNTGATWKLVSANSLLDSEAGNETVATAAAWTTSANFVPGAVQVDGVAVKLYDRTGTTGTFTIELRNTTDNTTEGTCTVNCADFCSVATPGTTNEGGWVLFTFAAHTLDAADNHAVRCQTSDATQIKLYRNATAANVSRMVRTTTAAASPPAATSLLHIMEEKTGAGAATTRTVTMNAIAGAVTKYGSGTADSVCLTISDGGTLNYGNTAATNYYLQLDGNLIVYNGGTLTIGTVASPIPRDGTAVLEFDPAADGDLGLIVRNGGTFTAQGLSRTAAKNVTYCLLNTDEAVNSTSLGVDTDTGWLNNDVIVVASTSRTYTQSEAGAMNGDAAAAVLTVDGFGGAGGGLAYAHSGTSPTQAEVINLTRNVKIRSSSSTLMAYVYIQGNTATVDIDWVEFYYLGEASTGQYGLYITTTTGSCSVCYCSFWNTEDGCIYVSQMTSGDNVTISYNTFYNTNTASTSSYAIYFSFSSSASNSSIDHNVLVGTDGRGFFLSPSGGTTISYNRVGGIYNYGFYFSGACSGTISNLVCHSNSNAGYPIYIGGSTTAAINIEDIWIWRNDSVGIYLGTSYYTGSTINNALIFGNTSGGIQSNSFFGLTFNDCDFAGDVSYASTFGVDFLGGGGGHLFMDFNSCTFGVAAGIYDVHSTADFGNSGGGKTNIHLNFNNCTFGSVTEFNSAITDSLQWDSLISSTYHDASGTTHKSWKTNGAVQTDTAIFNTATPSMKCTPNSATYKLESGSFKVNVQSGQLCTPTVYVRESVVGDGTDYNGNRIRLIVKRNDGIGITADTVIDTATVASEGAWESLTGNTAVASANGVMEFVIDCDGTTGWINVDDFSATVT